MPSQLPNESGVPVRVTATGTVQIVATGKCALLGILAHFTAGATGATVQVFATVTATATNNALTGVIVFPSGEPTFLRVPAYSPSGMSAIVASGNNPDLTFFWNPVG